MRRPRARWAVAAWLASHLGCSHTRTLTLTVEPTPTSNEGRPVYLLVRTVTPQAYVAQSYPEVAALVGRPDATVRRSVVVFPGHNMALNLPIPDAAGQFAVYVLFTRPSGDWRYLFNAPPPERARVVLTTDRVLVNPPAGAAR